MQQITSEAMNEVEAAIKRYEDDVKVARLAPSTEATYLLHAQNFVRWLKGEFVPGAKLRGA